MIPCETPTKAYGINSDWQFSSPKALLGSSSRPSNHKLKALTQQYIILNLMFYRIFIYEGSNVSNTSYREEELEDDVFEEDNGDIFENEVILQLMLFFNEFIYS